jgi:hypothetical protein
VGWLRGRDIFDPSRERLGFVLVGYFGLLRLGVFFLIQGSSPMPDPVTGQLISISFGRHDPTPHYITTAENRMLVFFIVAGLIFVVVNFIAYAIKHPRRKTS